MQLPAELLRIIFSHLRDGRDAVVYSHLGLVSCSLVCRWWYHCAFPLLLKYNNTYLNRDIDRYSNEDLKRLVSLMKEAQRYGLDHGTLFEWLEMSVHKLFVSKFRGKGLDHRRVDDIGRLVRALQPHMKSVKLILHGTSSPNEMKTLREFVTQLCRSVPDFTTLHISYLFPMGAPALGVFRNFKPLQFLSSKPRRAPPVHPIIPLFHHLSSTLQSIHLSFAELNLPILQSLRACRNIRTARFHSVIFNVNDKNFASTISSWPHLRHLSIRNQDQQFISLAPTIARLSVNPPRNLEVLELDNCRSVEVLPVYPRLRTLLVCCSHTLISLAVPTNAGETTESADQFIAFLASLELPNLQNLDLSSLGNLTASSIALRLENEDAVRIKWPKLRSLHLSSCNNIAPAFIRAVIRSCPALEIVRTGYAFTNRRLSEVEGVIREAGFSKMDTHVEWTEGGSPWVKLKPGNRSKHIVGQSFEYAFM